MQDASLLRFLVDMRGADVDDRQVKQLQTLSKFSSQHFDFIIYLLLLVLSRDFASDKTIRTGFSSSCSICTSQFLWFVYCWGLCVCTYKFMCISFDKLYLFCLVFSNALINIWKYIISQIWHLSLDFSDSWGMTWSQCLLLAMKQQLLFLLGLSSCLLKYNSALFIKKALLV